MSTVTEAMDAATAALTDAVTEVRGVLSEVRTLKDTTTNQAATIINNFISRPPFTLYYCDPVDGNDNNSGTVIGSPKKDLATLVDNLGTTAAVVILLGDYVWRKRVNSYSSLTVRGAQRASNAQGWIDFQRTIVLTGTAENSPATNLGTFCSGLFCSGTSLQTLYCNIVLQEQPAGQNYSAHFHSDSGTSMSFRLGTLLVDGANSGCLASAFFANSFVYSDMTLGANAAGHLLFGVAAGANPNNAYQYTSNLTSA